MTNVILIARMDTFGRSDLAFSAFQQILLIARQMILAVMQTDVMLFLTSHNIAERGEARVLRAYGGDSCLK
jgi:hypothetical protein